MLFNRIEYITNPNYQLTTSHVLWASYLFPLLIIAIHYYLETAIAGLSAIILLICLSIPIFTFIIGYNEFYPINFSKIGIVRILPDSIQLNNKHYEYSKIKELKFLINDYKGKRIRSMVLWEAGPTKSNGVDNQIQFESENTHVVIQFQINSKSEFELLGKTLTKLYRNGISFDEVSQYSKSYGLKHLNYKQIQEYKNYS